MWQYFFKDLHFPNFLKIVEIPNLTKFGSNSVITPTCRVQACRRQFQYKISLNKCSLLQSNLYVTVPPSILAMPRASFNISELQSVQPLAGLHITSKSLANVSKIFRWRVMDANYLPAGKYIKKSSYLSKTLNFYNLSLKHDVISSIKLDIPTIFVTDLLSINPVLSKSTWFDECKWHLACVAAILRESSWL